MNEELLQLVYSKFKTDASYEEFKKDFVSNEELRKASYGKLKTEASYEEFIKDTGYSEKPKKESAVSTGSQLDSAQKRSNSGLPQETKNQKGISGLPTIPSNNITEEELNQVNQFVDEVINPDIVSIYDSYKEAGKITLPQQEKIKSQLNKQELGERSLWEDVNAFATGMLTTGYSIPIYNYSTEEELLKARVQKNKVDFLSELPKEKVEELNEYAVNRTIELDNINKNVLAEQTVLDEKGRLIVNNLKHMENGMKQLQESGKVVPEEGIKAYEDLYQELQGISRLYDKNINIIESNEGDIGNFQEELDLLKKNFGGLDYYKDVARLSTAEMIGGLMEFGVSTFEMGGAPGMPSVPNIEGHQFVKDFREEITRQRETLRPALAVGEIESVPDFGKWLAEQTATQLPTVTVLMASGGTTGLTALGASSGGQKMGQLRDENDEKVQAYNESVKDIEENLMYTDEEKREAIKKLKPIDTYNPLEIYLAGIAVGTSEALSEKITLGILSKGKRALTAIKRSGLEKEVRKGFTTYAKETIFSGLSEGGSEVGNQWVQNLVDILYLDKKDVHVFDGTEDALASGFALGSGMRVTPTIIGLGSKAFMDKTVRRKIVANTNKIEGYMSELENNPDLSDESKKFLQARVDRLTKETQQDFVDVLSKLPEIGEEGIKKLIKLDKKSNGILQLVKELENTDLSEEAKNDIKLDYKKQVEKILQEKDAILNPKEDGAKQEAQQNIKEDVKPKESSETTLATKEGVDEGTKGSDKIQGENGAQQSVDGNGDGVQQDSDGDKGDSQFGVEDFSKIAVKAAKTGADVLSAGINHLKNTDWYKSLSDSDKKKAEKEFINVIEGKPSKSEGRKGIEEQLDSYLDEGMSELEATIQFETEKERMIAKDILTRRKSVDKDNVIKKVDDSYNKAKKEMYAKKSTLSFFNKGLRSIAKNLWDRQYLPKMLLMKSGGKLIRNYIITSKGASGFAKYNYDKAYDKIYKGLSSKDIEILDKIILQKRFISIDENREQRGLDPIVHPDFQNKDTSKAYLEELKNQLGKDKFNDLNNRAKEYFNSFKELLDSMYESGIVNKEFRDSFFDVDYQPRVFLKFLTDQEQEMSIIEMGAPESASLGSKQIQELESGSNESLIIDSMYLIARSMNTRAKSNAMNLTNKKLVEFMDEQAEVIEKLKDKKNPTRKEKNTIKYFEELSKRVKKNPIIGFTKSGNPKYKHSPKFGEKAQTYYVNGVKNQIIMEETFFDQYNDNLKAVFNNSNVREKASLLSLSGLVKTIATGNNPAFFITNSPRDLMFIATFSEEYGTFVPINLLKIVKDTYKGIKDMRKDSNTFQQFVKHGGMLDFLHTQGKFKGTNTIRRVINNVVDNKVQEKGKTIFNWATFSKLQVYSEIGFRMGVFNRSISNQLKELGLNNIESATKEQQEDIYTNAAASARNTTDFSQGGIYTKDADALVPYLNAGVQGTRVAIENLHERPAETILRMTQSAAILASVPITASLALLGYADRNEEEKDLTVTELYLKALGGVSKYDKVNYQIIFNGKRDADGEFMFYRISKPHFLTPLITYAQGVQHNIMREGVGLEPKDTTIEDVKFALEKNISPVDMTVTGNISKNPILKAALTYTTGYDFYRDQDLSYLRGKVPVPVEGHESKSVEDFYKKMGEDNLISPARMKGATESLITTPSTSPFIGVLYGGLDMIFSDKDASDSMDDVRKSLLKSITGRFLKSTSEFNRREDWDKLFLEAFSRAEIANLKNKIIFKDLARKLVKGEVGNEEVNAEFKRMAGEDVFEFERLVKTFTATIEDPKANPVILDLKFRKPYQRALILAEIFGDKLLEEGKELGKVNKELRNELFSNDIMNDETIVKYLELVKKDKGGN